MWIGYCWHHGIIYYCPQTLNLLLAILPPYIIMSIVYNIHLYYVHMVMEIPMFNIVIEKLT